MSTYARDRISGQTAEEWLAEYTGAHSSAPAVDKQFITGLVFDHHRTTKTGSVVLSFRWQFDEVVAFFNCDIRRQRGPLKEQSYQTGIRGQFLPPGCGKFRAFWQESVGAPPRRWAAVHKEIRSRLKGLEFQGEMYTAKKKNGEAYKKVINLHLSDPGY
jgi:hypothetical protein